MSDSHVRQISRELDLNPTQVEATAGLIREGATVPFIARYRKEATGSLDEVAITGIRDRLRRLEELDRRRASILKSLEERSLLTEELQAAIDRAETLNELEDLYQPYRPKRRTRAMIAREQGLEPLARRLWLQEADMVPESEAKPFVDAEKGLETADRVLAGARDIVAEWISDDPAARAEMRSCYADEGIVTSKVIGGKEESGAKFKDYFDWQEPVSSIPSHRMLALRRGEAEGILVVRIKPSDDQAIGLLARRFVTGAGAASRQVRMAVEDGYKRLLGPAMEGETRMAAKKKADEEAIRVFAENLRELLMAPRLGEKTVLAIDPGHRTGCKVVCLDAQGKLLHHDVVYPLQQPEASGRTLEGLCERFGIQAIAIGNGTGGRETDAFVRRLRLPQGIIITMVNESGASVYSASEPAREEFPQHDVTVRGAVSIGRRLMDPLAELVKIDPQSIGVGQYQHDVDPVSLKGSLDDVVVSCVNRVGVEVNTASHQLLSYVSGVGPQLARNLVAYRQENGPFGSRADLKKVARLGPKAFEQAAGFLRIRNGANPLDASAVHPESYGVVQAMTRDLGCSVKDLMQDAGLREKMDLGRYVGDGVGLPTIQDILQELAKPGRDPRPAFEGMQFKEGIDRMEDLQSGMKLPGIVTNVTAFGAFVDVGVHQDGLVHISQLADFFVKDPAEVVKVHQKVQVTVLEVDLRRRRIALSMRSAPEIPADGSSARPPSGLGPKKHEKANASSQRGSSRSSDWFSQALSEAERWKKGDS